MNDKTTTRQDAEAQGLKLAAVELYEQGLSLRAVEEATGINRETIRRLVHEHSNIRHRLARHGDERSRILSKIKVLPSGCWHWTGCQNNQGYGLVSFRGRQTAAHRAVYTLLVKAPPVGLDCCHACDVPQCVNPGHIFLGTRADNMRDASQKGRTARGENAAGAVLTNSIVLESRERFAAGEPISSIASDFGVKHKTLWAAIRGDTWGHL